MTEKPTEKRFVPVKDLTKSQLVNLNICSRCAHCADYCPTYSEARKRELIPGGRAALLSNLVRKQKGILAKILGPRAVSPEELKRIVSSLYVCTLCGRCAEVCPFAIQTRELWESFRAIIHGIGESPSPMKQVDRNVVDTTNPYGADVELRTMWIDTTGLSEAPMKEKANLVYFVGCTSAIKAQAQSIAFATASLLNKAKEEWTLLGEKELCCGNPTISVGDMEEAKRLAKQNVTTIESTGAKRVVASCPGCYRVLKFVYSQLIGRAPQFEVLHTSELFDEYMRKGMLKVDNRIKERVAFHDPCELSRLSGIYREPRSILRRVAENLAELPENRMDTRCCGGGGVLQAVDNEMRVRIAQRRVKQAEGVGAKILASACPACKITLSEAVRGMNSAVRVVDLNELLTE